jgi:hypothetical protein
MTLWRLEGTHLPSQTQGQIVPEYYGDLHKDIAGYPLQVGYSAQLADNCGADLTQTVLKLSSPDLDTIRAALAPGMPVVAQIDDEWVYVTAFLDWPWRIVVTRGYSGTTIATHAKGAEVYFIESRPIYVFASAPPGCRYPSDAVVQLRLNDVAQTPPCTVRLQDDRLVPGARFVTAEFDLTRAFGGAAPPPASRRIVLETPRPAEALGGRVTVAPQATRSDLMHAAVHYRAGAPRGQVGGFRRIRGGPAASPAAGPAPPAIPPAGREGRGGEVLGPAASAPVRIRAAPLGDCTMDLQGLLDTPEGRYTGTGSAPLRDPAAITACLLESTYGEGHRHQPTWATTAAHQQTLNLRWQVIWKGDAFETFRERAGFNGLADLWLDEDGAWRYTMHHTAAPVTTLTPREILGEVAVGFLAPSATHLTVTWGEGLTRGSFTLETLEMIARYGRIQDRALGLPWIASEAIARTVAAQWLPKWDRDRWTATVAVAPSLAALTRTDRVLIDTPILNPYGLVWEIRGTTDRGDQRVLTLIEGDATGETLPGFLGGTIRATARATGTVGVLVGMLAGAGTGTAIATGALTTFGAAALGGAGVATATALGALTTAAAGAALAGALIGQGTASGTLAIVSPGPTVLATATGSTPSSGNTAATSYTVAIVVPSSATNRWLVVIAGVDTSGAGPWTSVASNLDGSLTATGMNIANTWDASRLAAWAIINPTIGTHTITLTHAGAARRGRAMTLLLTGVHQTTPAGAALHASHLDAPPTSTAATLTMTGAAADKLSLAAMSFDSTSYAERDLVPTGGATEYAEWSGACEAGHLSVVGALGAATLGWTWTGSAIRWLVGGHVINAA